MGALPRLGEWLTQRAAGGALGASGSTAIASHSSLPFDPRFLAPAKNRPSSSEVVKPGSVAWGGVRGTGETWPVRARAGRPGPTTAPVVADRGSSGAGARRRVHRRIQSLLRSTGGDRPPVPLARPGEAGRELLRPTR